MTLIATTPNIEILEIFLCHLRVFEKIETLYYTG